MNRFKCVILAALFIAGHQLMAMKALKDKQIKVAQEQLKVAQQKRLDFWRMSSSEKFERVFKLEQEIKAAQDEHNEDLVRSKKEEKQAIAQEVLNECPKQLPDALEKRKAIIEKVINPDGSIEYEFNVLRADVMAGVKMPNDLRANIQKAYEAELASFNANHIIDTMVKIVLPSNESQYGKAHFKVATDAERRRFNLEYIIQYVPLTVASINKNDIQDAYKKILTEASHHNIKNIVFPPLLVRLAPEVEVATIDWSIIAESHLYALSHNYLPNATPNDFGFFEQAYQPMKLKKIYIMINKEQKETGKIVKNSDTINYSYVFSGFYT